MFCFRDFTAKFLLLGLYYSIWVGRCRAVEVRGAKGGLSPPNFLTTKFFLLLTIIKKLKKLKF